MTYLRNQTDVNITKVLSFDLELELTEGLDEGHAFYISHCSTELEGHSYFRGHAPHRPAVAWLSNKHTLSPQFRNKQKCNMGSSGPHSVNQQ